MLDTTSDAVLILDDQGRVECFNRAAKRLFEYDEREALDLHIGKLVTDVDAAVSGIGVICIPGEDVVAHRRDGRTFPARLLVGEVADVTPACFVAVVRDMTAHNEMRRAHERLAQVSRLTTLGELLGGIAHELNQPLAAITTLAQASGRLLENPECEIPEVQDALAQIASQALRAGDSIKRLRKLGWQQTSQPVSCDLNEVVLELASLIESDARLHGVSIKFDLAPDTLLAELDTAQIQQLLLNLLRNSIEAFTEEPAGFPEIIICTRRTVNGFIELWVCDNGPGVDPHIGLRLFHPFCTTKPMGTGLGLAMSRTIAETHGGKLEHLPRETQGAIFRLTLPAEEPLHDGK